MNNILRLKDVSMTYHSKGGETLAVDKINMEVGEGEFYGLVGPSGSGKTTLLSLLAGIISPTSGEILFESGEIRPKDIGYMLQRDQLFEWRNILSNIMLGLEIRRQKTPQSTKYALELLKKYSLSDVANKHPSELSGGMRQRVALIRTLVLNPKIILLDEPFSALDYQTRLSVAEDVHKIIKNENITAILVTHDISEAIALCDRVAILSRRPARIKKVLDVNMDKALTTLERRETSQFAPLFHTIWREMEFQDG